MPVIEQVESVNILSFLLMEIIQVIDFKLENDNIWHIIFYIFFMPIVSFIASFFIKDNKQKSFAIFAGIFPLVIFLIFGNGMDIKENLEIIDRDILYVLCFPSFIGAILGNWFYVLVNKLSNRGKE